MELFSTEIKVISVEPREHPGKFWYRIEGMDLNSDKRMFFSYWNKTPEPIKDKNYAIRYSVKDKYNNISDLVEIKLTKDGYIEVKVPSESEIETLKDETPIPTQKNYTELSREDQIISTLNLILIDIKELKTELDTVSKFIYSKE